MKGYVHSIETFGTLDGPGIRYVLFLKGCPMRCKYCHNPDTWTMANAKVTDEDDIASWVIKYRNYYKNGGITVSGGEPLVQIDFVTALFKKLKGEGIHTCVDTSGITFDKNDPAVLAKFDELMKYTDLVLLDIKHINNEEHIKLTSKSNKNILEFARYLDEKQIPVWIRHVLVPGITTIEKYQRELKEFIDTLSNVKKVTVLPYHTLGVNKYEKLGIDYPLKGVEPPSKAQIESAKSILSIK